MFTSYFKTAIRNLIVNRMYSGISIIGLSLGLAAFLLLTLFVREETRYDNYHSNADRLYRITQDILTNGGELDRRLSTSSPQIAPLLLEDFPELDDSGRLLLSSGWKIVVNDSAYTDDYVAFADASLMSMFDFDWLQGEPQQALARPDSIVLTESVAQRMFGASDFSSVLGQTVEVEGTKLLTVTGVIADLPNYTHMVVDVFVSINVVPEFYKDNALYDWSNGNFFTYLLLKPSADINSLIASFDTFLSKHMGENAVRARLHAMKVEDIHLHWAGGDMKRTSSVEANLYYFLVGLSILLIACCNYTNLALAASLKRVREVGIRKTLGASRIQLIIQHTVEALLVVLTACALALVFVELLLPLFNAFIRESLQFSLLNDLPMLMIVVSIVLTVSFLSSLYPAFYLSRLKPGAVLVSNRGSKRSQFFSRGLVVLQFSLSILFVVTAIAMSAQMSFLRNQDNGFTVAGLVRINNNLSDNLGERWPDFKRSLEMHPGISAVSAANRGAFKGLGAGSRIRVNGEDQGSLLPHLLVDEDFFTAYNIPLLAGRYFTADGQDSLSGSENDSASWNGNFIIGESTAGRFGWEPEEAIGQLLESGLNNSFIPGRVVGVVEDAYFESVRSEQRPMVYRQAQETSFSTTMRHIVVRLNTEDVSETMAFIDETWNRLVPETAIQRRFVEQDFDILYIIEVKLGQLFGIVSGLTVAIACMGLFGLAAFNTESRTKEIGIRKVMGSGVWGIVMLISSQFSRLVLIANLLAWPVAWYAMQLWLQQYTERISLTPIIFIGSGAITLCIAWVTVGGTVAKAASQKPVLALRYE